MKEEVRSKVRIQENLAKCRGERTIPIEENGGKRLMYFIMNLMRGRAMNETKLSRQLKGLYTAAMINVVIWAMALIALTILLQKGGNLKGMFVILAGGVAVGIQIITAVSKIETA